MRSSQAQALARQVDERAVVAASAPAPAVVQSQASGVEQEPQAEAEEMAAPARPEAITQPKPATASPRGIDLQSPSVLAPSPMAVRSVPERPVRPVPLHASPDLLSASRNLLGQVKSAMVDQSWVPHVLASRVAVPETLGSPARRTEPRAAARSAERPSPTVRQETPAVFHRLHEGLTDSARLRMGLSPTGGRHHAQRAPPPVHDQVQRIAEVRDLAARAQRARARQRALRHTHRTPASRADAPRPKVVSPPVRRPDVLAVLAPPPPPPPLPPNAGFLLGSPSRRLREPDGGPVRYVASPRAHGLVALRGGDPRSPLG